MYMCTCTCIKDKVCNSKLKFLKVESVLVYVSEKQYSNFLGPVKIGDSPLPPSKSLTFSYTILTYDVQLQNEIAGFLLRFH